MARPWSSARTAAPGIRPGPSHGPGDLRCLGQADLQPADRLRAGLDQGDPEPCGKLGDFAGRAPIHVSSAQGRQVSQDRGFHADARFRRRRRRLHLRSPDEQGRSVLRLCRRRVALFRGDVDAGADQIGRAGRRCDGQVHADAGRGAVHRRPRHGLRFDPVEGICRQARGRGQEGDARPRPGRNRALPVRRATTRAPSSASDPIPTIGAASRRSTISSSW